MSDAPDKPVQPPVLTNRFAQEPGLLELQRSCGCVDKTPNAKGKPCWREPQFHLEEQDEDCAAWTRLLQLIDDAARDRREEFAPFREMTTEQRLQIKALPRSIATLQSVKHLMLYGSMLVRIPPEIGEMTSLEQFTPYTSYRLHWFPYEITRCKKLRQSTVSTRALFGNFKNRPPFPRLPNLHPLLVPQQCSICRSSLSGVTPLQYWLSLGVATDVLPLLVHACSNDCVAQLPPPAANYVQQLHQGGVGLSQPSGR